MEELSLHRSVSERLRASGAQYAAYAGIGALGVMLYWLSADHPSLMPAWMPWDFSAPEYLATALTLFWFWRGLAASPAAERPPAWRRVTFLLGLGVIYAVLQTHLLRRQPPLAAC